MEYSFSQMDWTFFMTQHSSGTSDSLGLFTPAVMSVHVSKKKKIFTECVTGPEAARGPHLESWAKEGLQGFLKQEQHRFHNNKGTSQGWLFQVHTAGQAFGPRREKPSGGCGPCPRARCF